ncbi:MAG: HD domain-containing protein [Anaerolineae bacterium]|nr:HD domain-containing protein [Anaerolineae bacterium]
MTPPQQRLRQGLRALLAFTQPVDVALAARYLTTPALLALFKQLRRSEQLHSLHVLRGVLASGETLPALAIAALLHDCGKIRYPTNTLQKTVGVLIRSLAPGLARRLREGNPANPLIRPLVVAYHHPAWSATLLREAGAPADAIWLAAHHQEPAAQHIGHPLIEPLQRLQAADEAN